MRLCYLDIEFICGYQSSRGSILCALFSEYGKTIASKLEESCFRVYFGKEEILQENWNWKQIGFVLQVA